MSTTAPSIFSLLRRYLNQEACAGRYESLLVTRLPPEPVAPASQPAAAQTPHTATYAAAKPAPATAGEHEEEYLVASDLPQQRRPFVPPPGNKQSQLDALREHIGDCPLCPVLVRNRKRIVFGDGNPDAELMFVGEAPGRDEDIQGIPFVGRAGQLLTSIIEKGMNIPRKEVYIANILKCRPPNNRDPEKDEVANCTPFLNAQLEIIKPKVIIALGRYAAMYLTGETGALGRLRGRFHSYNDIPVMPTYHPAYLCRNYSEHNRRAVWEDVQQVLKFIGK
jgi:DNA polymerase